jgi:Trypsin-co-occurring domain 1
LAYLLALPVDTPDEGVVVFEAERTQIPDDLVLATPDVGEVAGKAQISLAEAFRRLEPSLEKLVQLLKALAPDESTVEFGLKIGGETGVIIAKGTAEVNFVVRLSWKQR